MKLRLITLGIGCAVLIAAVVSEKTDVVHGQTTVSTAGCRNRVVDEMSKVHDEYRAHIFGARKNRNGDFEVLTGGLASQTGTGIMETKARLTSELVWPAVESYRILRCKTGAICFAMKDSFFADQDAQLTIRQLGCTDETITSYPECAFADAGLMQSPADDLTSECQTLNDTSLDMERAVLHLAFAYDSGYRSILQLAGMIEWFQGDFPDTVLGPIRDMVGMLGKLHEIPCFIGQCDHPDTTTLIGPPFGI